MFHVVTKANRERYARQLEAMHAHRPEMFEVQPGGGPEAAAGRGGRDRFDDQYAVYVMSLDSWGEIECCVRLRPTSQGSIIGSFYPRGVRPEERQPGDLNTWEMSHYYARGGARGQAGWRLRAQLRLATMATAAEAGADRMISVCEASFWPPAERCGWRARRLGPAFAYCDGGEAMVYEVDTTLDAVAAFHGYIAMDGDTEEVAAEAGQVAAVAGLLGMDGLELVSSLTRRIAGVEETDGPDAAMALAESLNRAASLARPQDS